MIGDRVAMIRPQRVETDPLEAARQALNDALSAIPEGLTRLVGGLVAAERADALSDITATEIHALRETVATVRARVRTLDEAVRWALGEHEDFPPREPGQGPYWWRDELRKRAGA